MINDNDAISWVNADPKDLGLDRKWVENFCLTERTEKQLSSAVKFYAMEVEKTRIEMLEDNSVALRTILLIPITKEPWIDIEVYGLSNPSVDTAKDNYAKEMRSTIRDKSPIFVIQTFEAWKAEVSDLSELEGKMVSDIENSREVVMNMLFTNIYGQILAVNSTKEIERNSETNEVSNLRSKPIRITHGDGKYVGRLLPFEDLLPEIQ